MSTFVLVVAGAAVVTAVATPGCIWLAHRSGLIDRPGPLKPHHAPVAYLGGVAVFAGLLVGACAGRPIVLAPLAGALALGVTDDAVELPAPLRLIAELVVGAGIAASVPLHLPGWVGVPLVMLACVVLINGFNLLDGLDMLATGVAASAAIGFAVLTHGPGRLLAASVVGALIAFLWFNRPPARIYLGDGGSYLLGAAMTALLAYSWGDGVAAHTGVLALALLIVPSAEISCAVVRRHRAGRSLLAGDRSHPYDLLVARGWSGPAASGTYIGIEVMMMAVVSVAVGTGLTSVTGAVVIDLVAAALIITGAALVGGLHSSEETTT